jgi:hypothetical protein
VTTDVLGIRALPKLESDIFLVLIIPLQTLPKLRISMKKKLTLFVLFAAANFAIIAAVVRCVIAVHNPNGLAQVILWSTVEETVCTLVANGPVLRPLIFRGKGFASDVTSSHGRTGTGGYHGTYRGGGGRSNHDIYEMTPKERGVGVVSVVSSEPNKEIGKAVEVNTMEVLRTVEVTVHTEDTKKGDDGSSYQSSGTWLP